MRRERTVFDGIEPNDALNPPVVDVCPVLIQAWEESLAQRDEKIADLMKARAAHVRNIAAARRKLGQGYEEQIMKEVDFDLGPLHWAPGGKPKT